MPRSSIARLHGSSIFKIFRNLHTDLCSSINVGSEKGDQERIKIGTEKGCGGKQLKDPCDMKEVKRLGSF